MNTRLTIFRVRCVLAVLVALCTGAGTVASAALDETGRSASLLIARGLEVQPRNQHRLVLQALRHLKDPAAEPLLRYLAQRPEPALRIHGILGLAELDPQQRVDLEQVIEVDEPAVQAELITAAMNSDLLTKQDAQTLLSWPGLEPSVKVLVATQLLEADALQDASFLHEALESDSLGRRGLAGLLLHQMGDTAGTQTLQALNRSEDPQRDMVRAMLLQTALRHEFERCANWAHAIAAAGPTDAGAASSDQLTMLAIQTALRFAHPPTVALWRQRYQAAPDLAARIRLALLALRMSPWLTASPEVFDDLLASDDTLLVQMGRTGQAIAAGDPGLTEHAVNLLLTHHPRIGAWALDYAREMAADTDAQLILLGVIRAFEHGPQRTRMKRLDSVIEASRTLYERFPVVATQLLRPIVQSTQSDPMLVQAILLGLVRCRDDAHPVIADLPDFTDIDTQSLALLLLARSDAGMSQRQLRDLSTLVRGGGKLQDSLRVQAAWSYLKRTNQLDAALRQAMER